MKSAWKFIVQLTSRRASAKAQDSSTGNDTDPKALESEVEHASALLPSSKLVDQESSASDKAKGGDSVAQVIRPPIDDAQAHAPARREADNTVGEQPSLARKNAVSTKSQTKARIKRRERGEKATRRWLHRPLSPQRIIQACNSRLHGICSLMKWQHSMQKSKC